MRRRVGAITIGQAPRVDVISEIRAVLGADVEFVEGGALDGLSPEEVAALAPGAEDQVLVTRLRDGRGVRVAHRHIVPLVQRRLDELAPRVDAVLLLCTGTFPVLQSPRPVLYPERVLYAAVQAVAPEAHVGVIAPDESQVREQAERWGRVARRVTALPLSPYDPGGDLARVAVDLTRAGANLVVLDSLGYDRSMKETVRRASGLPVLLPRTLLGRVAAELL